MVSATDLKFYKSKNAGLGGDIDTSLEIISSTPNNLFGNVPRSEQVTGDDYYMCAYLKDTSSEKMGDLAFWLSSDTQQSDTQVKWAKEVNYHKYKYAPWKDFNGTSDFTEKAHATNFNLTKFTLSAWVNFTTNFASLKVIVGKGVDGSETSANNWNYVIYVDSSERFVGGFEESGGTDHLATSPSSYNDGKWHFVTVTYDLITVRLYVDGTQVATAATTTTPNTNSHPIRTGSDSTGTAGTFFTGKIDEVRIWNTDLTSTEVTDLYNGTDIPKVDTDNLVYEEKNGNDNGTKIAQEIADQYTAPSGITDWLDATSTEPTGDDLIGTFRNGMYYPVWIWWHVDANAEDFRKDRAIFSFAFTITSGGTGTPGDQDNSGGNPLPTPTDYKIAVVGDWGEENETDDVVSLIKNNGYNLVIGCGDNSYTSSDSQWFPIIKSIDDNQGSSIQWESANGNHDDPKALSTHLHQQKAYYSFDFQNTHVLVLDTEESMTGAQLTFATNDLKAQDSRSNIDYCFVVFHRPMTGPSSSHGTNTESQIENYADLFLAHKVVMVFQGHNHHWYRSLPIKHTSGSSMAKVISDSNGPYIVGQPANWLINVTSGTGGHDPADNLYPINNPPSYSAFTNNSNNGIFSITASNGGQTLTCKFINTGKDEFDEFVINNN